MGQLYLAPREEWKRTAGWLVPGDNCTELQYRIVERAFRDVGIYETPPGSNRGTRIDAYAKRAGSPLGSWWCAIWAGAVFADCGAMIPKNYPLTDEWTPHLVDEPVVGAAILYGLRKRGPVRRDMDAHHMGIVVRYEPDWPVRQYRINTIEGNRGFAGTTNNGVAVDFGPVTRTDILGYFHPRESL